MTLSGEVNAYTAPLLRDVLDEVVTDKLVIDLREVDGLDAAGLGFLVACAGERPVHGPATGLVVSGGVEQLFTYTRLRRAAVLFPSVDAALDVIGRPSPTPEGTPRLRRGRPGSP